MAETARKAEGIEWPTVGLMLACYALWALATTWLTTLWLPLGMVVAVLTIALHSSLTHEALHGHPFRVNALNEATVFLCLGLFVPYRRFKDLHLAHHVDEILTDPYDDPESNYLDPKVWGTLPRWRQILLRFNNTLAGRLVVGPSISIHVMLTEDWAAIRAGDRKVLNGWLLHIPGVIPVIWWVVQSPMPLWAYVISAYAGYSILKIRTYLEHRAYEQAKGRTVVIDDKGLLAFLFLNNNLHVVHHAHPGVAWYRLPQLWAKDREMYLERNDGYFYRSYGEIFRKHFLKAKDPVPHPLWTQGGPLD